MKNKSLNCKVHNRILKDSLAAPGSTVIVGLSGGPDSVALLHILKELAPELNLKLVAAHLDHGWRPESAQEAQFCRELCDQWRIPLVSGQLADYSSGIKFNGSQEEFARMGRRRFFEQVQKEQEATVIALAHHADDQIETFFIRLLRGASLAGLVGMRAQQGAYIRPLLGCSKQEILAYLKEHAITYLSDPTNTSDAFLRNRIRHSLMPVLHTVDARAGSTILQTIERLAHTRDYVEAHTKQVWSQIAKCPDGVWQVDTQQLFAQHTSMRQQLMMHWLLLEGVPFVPAQDFFTEIERFLGKNGSKRHQLHTTWGIKKQKSTAHIFRAIHQ